MNALDQGLATDRQGACLNCGGSLSGPFCAACGQKARLHRSLSAFFSDLVAGLFNFESRFWRTIPMLAWCPGDLTRRYVEGQRARFISPIALYLFSVFLMFAALNATTGGLDGVKIRSDFNQALAEERAQLARLEGERRVAIQGNLPRADIERRIAAQRTEIEQLEKLVAGRMVEADTSSGDAPPWLIEAVRKIEANPRGVMGQVQEAASKYSWALIPLSLPFMFLLFPLRRGHIFDHAVFVTYSLSFMMLLILIASLMVVAGLGGWASWLVLLPPIHMYRQLKGAYRLRWWSALIRTVALLFLSFKALSLFGAAMLTLGLLE